MDLDPETDLSFTRTLSVPRSLVWECWTSPEHIPYFSVSRTHMVTACDINLRVGSRSNTTFEVEHNRMDNHGVFPELIRSEKLVFTNAYTEGWKPRSDPFMTAILLLTDVLGGGTTYTAIARHRSAETRKAHEDMGFHGGWGTVVTQFAECAKGRLK